jgi:hypothetical protein
MALQRLIFFLKIGMQQSLPLPLGWDWLHVPPSREGYSLHGQEESLLAIEMHSLGGQTIKTVQSQWPGGIPLGHQDCTVLTARSVEFFTPLIYSLFSLYFFSLFSFMNLLDLD